MNTNLQVIKLRPVKKKKVRLSELAKGILKRQKTRSITVQGQFYDAERRRIIVKLNNFYLGKPSVTKFPIEIEASCEKDGFMNYKGNHYKLMPIYEKLAAFFESQGFMTECYFEQSYPDRKDMQHFYAAVLKITGIYGMNKE